MEFSIDERLRDAMGGPPAEWTERQQSLWYCGWLAFECDYEHAQVRRALERSPDGLSEVRAGWEARLAVHRRGR